MNFLTALLLALVFIATGFLTGCLEGSQRSYYEPTRNAVEQGENGGPSTSFVGDDEAIFKKPIGYPLQGEFVKDVKRVDVTTQEEIVQALKDQTGPMIVSVTQQIDVSEMLNVHFPLIIQTRNDINDRSVSLSFISKLSDSEGVLKTGTLLVHEPNYLNTKLDCGKAIGITSTSKQLFVMLKGVIVSPNIDLRSPTHFVLESVGIDGNFSAPKLNSTSHDTTVFITGPLRSELSVIAIDKLRGKFVFGKDVYFSFNQMSTTLGNSPMLPFGSGIFGSTSSVSVLDFTNICLTQAQLKYATQNAESNFWYYAGLNETHCKRDGWFDESAARARCSAEKDGAK